MKILLLVLSLTTAFAVSAKNKSPSGGVFLKYCDEVFKADRLLSLQILKKTNTHKVGFCMGYIAGVYEVALSYEINNICIPIGAEYKQAVWIAYKYLKDHPERLDEHKVYLVLDAFNEAWPCEPE